MIHSYGTGAMHKVLLMSNIVTRYIANLKKKSANYKADALRYRGVVYKQIG
jgi:hypothetical protein